MTKSPQWREGFAVYHKRNEWHPDATPLDVENFIDKTLKAHLQNIRERVAKLKIKEPRCYCREYSMGEHDCGETANEVIEEILEVIDEERI